MAVSVAAASTSGKMSAAERQSLLGTADLEKRTSTDRLKQAQRVVADTEELGSGILSELRSQRDILSRSKATLDSSDVDLDRGRRLLRSMATRAQANRATTVAICLAVVVFFAFLMMWQGGGGNSDDDSLADVAAASAPP
mmetsp:Transcript_857/g.2257  ORF Transcript_857/g.2257 Transcript_857/m.2257 type:complete len:140 (-) Transcript_857:201-620(-)